MGCCTSNMKLPGTMHAKSRSSDLNATLDSYYMASTPGSARSGSKRSYTSRRSLSSASSGLGSGCTTPSRRSIWSRSCTPSRSECGTPKPKPNQQRNEPRSICDDFAEHPAVLERSCGYHTCSSAASTPSKPTTPAATPLPMDTQDSSMISSSSAAGIGNLEWEMYMMAHAQCIMPKTSSPICLRRDATFEIAAALPSRSYQKWRNYLQCTPAHMLHNITHIPEAIAGHFCPTDFPAFSDLEDMESAAKRYKVDATPDMYSTTQMLNGQTHTITTDL